MTQGEKIRILEAKILSYKAAIRNIDNILESAVNVISNLDKLYEISDLQQKRDLIGSIFPEKLVFDGFQYRTKKTNEVVSLISLISNELTGNKNWTSDEKQRLSNKVSGITVELILPILTFFNGLKL